MAGLELLGAGTDPLSVAIQHGTEQAVMLSAEHYPEETAATLSVLFAIEESIDVTVEYLHESACQVVSSSWNSLDETTQNRLKGGAIVTSIVLPPAAVARLGAFVRAGKIDLPKAPTPKGDVPKKVAENGSKGAGNATSHAAGDIRFSPNTVSFNKTDRGNGAKYTYDDLVQSMRASGWKGDPVDVVKMPDGKMTSMDNTRIAAAREAGIDVKATVRGFHDPLTPAVQEARGWQQYSTWGEAIMGRINKQSGGFTSSNSYGASEVPRITGSKK